MPIFINWFFIAPRTEAELKTSIMSMAHRTTLAGEDGAITRYGGWVGVAFSCRQYVYAVQTSGGAAPRRYLDWNPGAGSDINDIDGSSGNVQGRSGYDEVFFFSHLHRLALIALCCMGVGT